MPRALPGERLSEVLAICNTVPGVKWTPDARAVEGVVKGTTIRVTATRITLRGARNERLNPQTLQRLPGALAQAVADLRAGRTREKARRERIAVPDLDSVKQAAPALPWTVNVRGTPSAVVGEGTISVNALLIRYRVNGVEVHRVAIGDDGLAAAINRALALAQETP